MQVEEEHESICLGIRDGADLVVVNRSILEIITPHTLTRVFVEVLMVVTEDIQCTPQESRPQTPERKNPLITALLRQLLHH